MVVPGPEDIADWELGSNVAVPGVGMIDLGHCIDFDIEGFVDWDYMRRDDEFVSTFVLV